MRALVLIILFLLSGALAQPPSNFGSAKTAAVKLWWDIGPSSFYCQCPYPPATVQEKQIRKGNLWVVGSACGYQGIVTLT